MCSHKSNTMKTNYLIVITLIFLWIFNVNGASVRGNENSNDKATSAVTKTPVPKLMVPNSNIALTAKVSTSYVSSWEKLSAVNDNYQPASSTDKGPGAYGNWRGAANFDTLDWVEYSFSGNSHIDSVRVYWWTDNGGIQIPYNAYIEYLGCGSYIKAGDIGIAKDKYNSLVVDTETYKIRISMRSTAATGILEFQVFGSTGTWSGLVPYIQVNSTPTEQTATIEANPGDTIKLSNGLTGIEGGTWQWTGPKGYTSNDSAIIITDFKQIQAGIYKAWFESNCGILYSQSFVVSMHITNEQSYYWPGYSPKLDYNFRQEFPALEEPTKDLNDCPQVVGTQSSGWWTFKWGPNKRSVVTEAAITPLLERMNEDFAYFRDTLGWPPDKRAKNGYRSAIYLYGSGLSCIDNADSNELGGWQSSIGAYPCVLASYYPIYSFDPSCTYSDRENQMGAMVHEGIHSVLADLPGCKDACWFQEGGNTWLQQEAASRQSGDYSTMGYLNGGTFLAPFMPIECYSGWLQDNSFGGPCAEGVNMFSGSTQICTWRNYLGGNQYGNAFPTALGTILGKGSIPWIWRYCPGRVLEGIADSLGDNQIRRLITEYRAKQAVVDMAEWTGAVRKLLDTYFNLNVKAEWAPSWITPETWIASPYARTTMDTTGTLTPEYRTTPGWSGANQIPLQVKSDSVYVNFKPIGKNMKCLIAYRDISGNPVYSEPVDSGACAFKLQRTPANDVVLAVVVNTDYIYNGEETRKAHFDYRIQIDTSLTIPANTHKRWYAWDESPENDIIPVLPEISKPDTFPPTSIALDLEVVQEDTKINTEIGVLTTTDENTVSYFTYTLVSGEGDDDNASFKIKGNKLQVKKLLDYETNPVCSIRIRSTNLTGKSIEKSFEITITDVIESSSIENYNSGKDLLVYPNPTEQQATIELKNNEIINKIEIINFTGSTVKVINNINSNIYTINRDSMSGIYYLKISCNCTSYFAKLIFQ